jgi:formylglycine-generating enzyme required for sulfatase activity/mono/diheme cytochrome c family protein
MSRFIHVAVVAAAALVTQREALWSADGGLERSPPRGSPPPAASRAADDVAKQAQALLKARCFECHGENGVASRDIFVLDRDRLLSDKVVVPGDRASPLLKMVETGAMPLAGEKLKPEEIAILQKWIDAGAPPFDAAKPLPRAFLPEETLHADIVRDLGAIDPRSQRFIRYFSIAHLYNAGVPDAELVGYRVGLAKLLNSLSWQREIAKPHPINESETLLRIDLRDFKWTFDSWGRVIGAYSYGWRGAGWKAIGDLSGAELPYVRADWFVARVSCPPLYHDALDLPVSVQELEKRLGVDTARNLREEKGCLRAGVRASGVSRSNRVVERHETAFGSYWKSYDFATSQGEQNIFTNPLRLRPDGGEMVFNLPNGMQAYFITDKDGKRIDSAPIEIVSDRTHPDEPVVKNGISCMGCHFAGMKSIKDEVRPVIEASTASTFDRSTALALYPAQETVDKVLRQDSERFAAAVAAAGGKIAVDHRTEPVNALARKFSADVPAVQAAAEVGLELPVFLERLRGSITLNALGFGQLLLPDGAIKRDVWEESFGTVIRELGVGEFLTPARNVGHEAAPGSYGAGKVAGQRQLSWAGVLEQRPDPKVVTDARHRAAIEKTGLPWRVIDRASGIEMVLVPAGSYLRGGAANDPEADGDEKPAHQVSITRPFYLGRTEVTNAQYRKVAPQHDAGSFRGQSFNGDAQPAVRVSWNDAKAFCDRFRLRLPTEAEWELACRAGTSTPRPGDVDALAIYANTSGNCTHPVGETRPNPWGLYDMLGNAWEWCWDWYDSNEYPRQRTRTNDPIAFATGPNRVLRGGSWHDKAKSLRSSSRGSLTPEKRDGGVGFRVARNP